MIQKGLPYGVIFKLFYCLFCRDQNGFNASHMDYHYMENPEKIETWMEVEPASSEFSISSFRALAGRWMTSPAAMRFTTTSSNFWMFLGFFAAMLLERLGLGPIVKGCPRHACCISSFDCSYYYARTYF